MQLSTFSSIFLAFLSIQGIFAALTPQQVALNIDSVAGASRDANAALSQLTTDTISTQVSTIGTNLANSFTTIINSLIGDVTAMQTTPPLVDNLTQPIIDSLEKFVVIHQNLLATVIGKHGIFAQFGFTAPILVVLQTLEGQIDAFALALIHLIPSRGDNVQASQAALDDSVQNSIQTYSQFCIPTLIFPPICVTLPPIPL